MLETERSSDEALRQPTYRRLYLGAHQIENPKRRLQACFIILLAGRVGLRTGEIQHVREEWVDWDRGELAIPRLDPCACMNCWIRAKEKAIDDDETLHDELAEVIEKNMPEDVDHDASEIVDEILGDEEELPDEVADEDDEDEEDEDERTAEEILYEERWQPKYERSARRVPFGHAPRLTAVIAQFIKQYDQLEITQVTMNNLVQDAAEHADGVDPDEVTIRGLRATAATHYALYIRNPKVLQDLMGWTRIETAARYLRRAGAYTTDIVYASFDKGDLAPAMFSEEPEERLPIIGNPLPYQDEPYDPMTYGKETRHVIGREFSDRPRRLIHPRSRNHPESLDYDPDKHPILTHEDFSDDIVERDGLTAFESPTLAEFYEAHERFPEVDVESDDSKRRYESEDEWEQHSFHDEDITKYAEQDDLRSPARLDAVFIFLNRYYALVEWVDERAMQIVARLPIETPVIQPSSIKTRIAIGLAGICLLIILFIFTLVQLGLFNIQTMSLENRPAALFSLVITVYTAYKLPSTSSLSEVFE